MLIPIVPIPHEEIEKLIREHIPDLDDKTREVTDRLVKAIGDIFAHIVKALAEFLIAIFGSSVKELGYLFGAWSAYRKSGSYEAMQEVRPELLDPMLLTTLFYRKHITDSMVYEELTKQGYSDERIDLIIKGKSAILDIASILKAFAINRITYTEAEEKLKHHGLSEDDARIAIDSTYRYLDIGDYIRLWLRGDIDEDMLEERLTILNIPAYERDLLKDLAFYIPPPADLIRMAVREAFSPEVAERFGQYEDFPEQFAEWAGKQGISDFWAKAYWASHWDLPSPMMGFEMLHRGIINEEELKLLLRALDVMPFWRDKMIQLSYAPLTRVDVRRMYKLGVISRDEVYRCYLDLGYSPENAERLTQFVEVEAVEAERDLTKAELLSAFEAGKITEREIIEHLLAMRYSEEEAKLLVELYTYKKEKKIKDAHIKAIRTKYLKNVIALDEAIRKLTALAIPATEIDSYIEVWKTEKMEISEELDLPDLKRALKLGIISKDDFEERLRKKGYNDIDINILAELVRKEIK